MNKRNNPRQLQNFSVKAIVSRTPNQSESINGGLAITILHHWNKAKNA